MRIKLDKWRILANKLNLKEFATKRKNVQDELNNPHFWDEEDEQAELERENPFNPYI